MTKFDKTDTNQPSQLFNQPTATRDGFGQGLLAAARRNQQIFGLCADLTGSMRLTEFEQEFPDRFVQVGVAEQNLIGVAAGLALAGKIPFAASFAVFSPGRSWDQIRVSVAYAKLNVKVIGGHAGLITGADGASHQALEDIAIMRSLPNFKVIEPADAAQAYQAVQTLANDHGPAYLRLTRPKLPIITDPQKKFTIGQAQILNPGTDAAIIACGAMTHQALQAAQILQQKHNLQARVINMATIKPIDRRTILAAAEQTSAIVTVEDHQIYGGLGSAVAEVLSQELGAVIDKSFKFKIMGIKDQFGESGSPDDLQKKYGLTAQDIVKTMLTLLES